MYKYIVTGILVFTGFAAHASGPDAKIWMNVEAGSGVPPWKARAIDGSVRELLATFPRVTFADKFEDANLIVHARVEPLKVRLESLGPRSSIPVASFTVPVGTGASMEELRHAVYRAVKPFVQADGILDAQPPPETGGLESLSRSALTFLIGAITALMLIRISSQLFTQLFREPGRTHFREKMAGSLGAAAWAISFALVAGLMILTTVQSIRFHKTYTERIGRIQTEIDNQKRIDQERRHVADEAAALPQRKFLTKKSNAGAGVAGFLAFAVLFTIASVLYITENYFASLLFVSFALLAYVAGREAARIFVSSITIFFSSKHLVKDANDIEEVLHALNEGLQLERGGKLPPAGQPVILPRNSLAEDLQRLLKDGKGFDYLEYVTHSYYVECHELYDSSSANLDFIAVSMPVFGLIGTVLGLMAMFDNLGGEITIDTLSPQLAMALKTTLYGALFSAIYKILCSRFERRIRTLDYDYETLCRGIQVLIENKISVELAK